MQSKHFFLFILLLFSAMHGFALETSPPATVVPEKRLVPEWRAERHAEKVAQAKAGGIDLVMIGDSITHNWERQKNYTETFAAYNTLNLGVGGARTQTVLWRLQNGEIDGIAPKWVTLMIGTNNAKRDTPENIFLGIQAIVAEVRTRLPESKIMVFSIFPRKPSPEYETVKAVNQMLPQLADQQQVFHADINKIFLDEQGEQIAECYGRDLLHLGAVGYTAWSKALIQILEGDDAALPTATKAAATGVNPIIRLWPIEHVGGEANRLKEEYRTSRGGSKQLCGIKDPNLTVFKADSDQPTPAVVYCPGGAYKILDPQAPLIQWLNDLGITVFMLKYTIPDNPDAAYQDIIRAMRLVRHQAQKWNIDPDKIGVVGNSAGGHLAARLTQNYNVKGYDAIDAADAVRCEPNFAILQCAAYFQGRRMDKDFDAQLFHMKHKVAPTFLTYAKDDKFTVGGVEYEKRLTASGGTIQLKLFEKGGHGMRDCDWFSPAAQWLKAQQIIKSK